MGRITGKRSSYGHRVSRLSGGYFAISWTVDTKIAGSRLRWPKTVSRHTDRAGAARFIKKWNLAVPPWFNIEE